MTLGDRRRLFTRLLTNELMPWAYRQTKDPGSPLFGCEFALDEVTVKSPRPVRKMGMVFEALDARHGNKGKFRSMHHDGQAVDLLIYRDKVPIFNGEAPEYKAVGRHWESLHELCFWGYSIQDANHLSLRDGARR